MAFCAKYLFVFILLVALGWIYWRLRQRIWVFITAFLGIATLSYLLAKLSTHLIIDPRPYIQYHLTPLISVAADNGFPSDHTLISFAAAATVALFDKKAGWVLCGLALLVGVARVYVAAHHPLDIAGSMLIVLISTFIVWCIGNFLAHRMAANQQQ
jgi:membrane-associated phospholipid phosphatase